MLGPPGKQAQEMADDDNLLPATSTFVLQSSNWSLAQLVCEDIAFFGDGCVFLDMVVQPVFNLMVEQIALMGDAGEAPALRLGYDDFNESVCMSEVIT